MKVIAIAVLLAALIQTPAYEVTRWVGDHGFLFSFRQNAQLAFAAPKDDALSEWQKLPFGWKFFGRDVTGYFISDNGYVTFDAAAKTSVAANTTLPNASAPANSIFAFWTNLKMDAGSNQWTNSVWTATLGQAPERVHVIYWMSVAPAGQTSATSPLSFAIALYENGEYEVIFTAGRRATTLKATIGATGPDGKSAVLAAGPDFDYPNVGFGGEDDVNYKFKSK